MKINIDKKAVGQRIKSIRLNKGMTLEEFGKLFNASFGNVKSWEIGNALPNKERIKTISKIGNISINELLYGDIWEFIETNVNLIVLEIALKTKKNIDAEDIQEMIFQFEIIDDYFYDVKNIDIDDEESIYTTFSKICRAIIDFDDYIDSLNNGLMLYIENSPYIEQYLEVNWLYIYYNGEKISLNFKEDFTKVYRCNNEKIKHKIENYNNLKSCYQGLEKYEDKECNTIKVTHETKSILIDTKNILEQIKKNNGEISDDLGANLEKSIKRIKELEKELDNK